MPPRLSTTVDDPTLVGTQISPTEAGMGQTSNGSVKRPREDDDVEDDDDEESGKKERIRFLRASR